MKDYNEFLKSKIKISEEYGFTLSMEEINPNLKPHNKLMVKWLVEGGKRACFASFGLHKTVTQLEAVRCTLSKLGGGCGLIVCPLSVRQEFVEDARNILKWNDEQLPRFIRRAEEMQGDGIYLTNYESIRDGRLDPMLFQVASLDEASVLRSSGDRGISPEEFSTLDAKGIFQAFKKYTLNEIWDFEYVVKVAETLELKGKLPSGFMLLQPQSWAEDVWTDVTRMRTLNGSQWSKGKEMHLCPMQFDIADRVIEQMSSPGDIVLDPFGGLMTVPYRALLKGRKAQAVELNPQYFLDGAQYCKAAEMNVEMPSLFDIEFCENESVL